MKSEISTFSLSKYSSTFSIIALILIFIDIFINITTLSIIGFLILGCVNLYDTIRMYTRFSSIHFFTLFNTIVSFIIAISDIFYIFKIK